MSIFPFIDPDPKENKIQRDLPMFKEYAYDYTENRLCLNADGNTYLVEGNEALRIWIYKALSTPRYRYTAYSADFGSEHENGLIGQSMADEILASELERYIIEALMINPYIKELNEFQFVLGTSGINAEFHCVTIYGEDKIMFEVKGVS